MKAHLVASGCEEDSHNLKTDSPTFSYEAMCIVMVTASVMKRWVESLNFTSVFLHGDKLGREIFFWPPSDIWPKSLVWKLKRCIYGLNDAPRSWYKSVNHDLTNLKGIVNTYVNALFLWHDATGNLMRILAMHIDDFIFCGNYFFQKDVITELIKIFKVGMHENETIKFAGLGISQTEDGITIDQNLYISSISQKRCPWCNGYRRRKWTRRHEFKSWARLIAFHIALIPLGKVWIQLFSLQLWVK